MPYVTADDGVKLYYEEIGRDSRSYLYTSSPMTFVATRRKSAILRVATAASLITHAATRPQTFQMTSRPIHRIWLAMMSGWCWMGSESSKPISSAFRWADSRPCILAWHIRAEPVHWSWLAAAMVRSRASALNSRPK